MAQNSIIALVKGKHFHASQKINCVRGNIALIAWRFLYVIPRHVCRKQETNSCEINFEVFFSEIAAEQIIAVSLYSWGK